MRADQQFLDALFGKILQGDLRLNVRALPHGRTDPRSLFFPSIDTLLADKQIPRWNMEGDRSIYFGVAPRNGSAGTKHACVGIPALWVDLDAKDFAVERAEGKRRIMEELTRRLPPELQPSILVDTGGGYQPYWLLREFAWIGGDWYTVETLEGYLRGLQRHLNADPSRTDVSSILRFPNTVNWKPDYPDHPLCHVVHLDASRRFNLSDFDEYLALSRERRATHNATGWVDGLLGGVDSPDTRPAGALGRDQAGAKLAGRYFRLGLGEAEVLMTLRGWNQENRPPLPDEDLRRIVHSIARTHHRNGGAPPQAPDVAAPITVPDAGMIGIGREFAELYAEHLESPRAFFYFSFLTYFGALVAKKITLDSELRPQPRLYTVLIGESADTRKSTALHKTHEFFHSLGPEWEPHVLFGVGSAEGVAAELKEHPDLVLHFDELKSFVDKAKNEHSVALPMVSTLFERNDYDNRTKTERLSIRGASLSLVAACTQETYATMFDRRFFAIGFLNRLWLVSDRSTVRIAVPGMIPEPQLDQLRARVIAHLKSIDEAYVANGWRPVPYRVTPGALELFRTWYANRGGSIFERRLEVYGHRLMLLLAATSGRQLIDEEIVERVLALLNYQLDVRRECDPVDAENAIATMEEKIRRALARGALKGRDLKRKVHYNRVGLWVWNTAIENLRRAKEVAHEAKGDLFWLTNTDPGVTISVTTTKNEDFASRDAGF